MPCGRQREVTEEERLPLKGVCPLNRQLGLPCLLTENVVLGQGASKQEKPQGRKGLITDEMLISLGFADKLQRLVSPGLRSESPSRLNFAKRQSFKNNNKIYELFGSVGHPVKHLIYMFIFNPPIYPLKVISSPFPFY